MFQAQLEIINVLLIKAVVSPVFSLNALAVFRIKEQPDRDRDADQVDDCLCNFQIGLQSFAMHG